MSDISFENKTLVITVEVDLLLFIYELTLPVWLKCFLHSFNFQTHHEKIPPTLSSH